MATGAGYQAGRDHAPRRVALGERNREIASALGLSDSTVKQEVQKVMRTMRTSDRLIAAERAHAGAGVVVDAGLLTGMPELLRVLSSSPHPDEVAAALVSGPGRRLGAASGAVLWARGSSLIVLGLHGYLREEVAGLDAIPIASDYPLSTAFREGEVLIEPIATAGELYPGLLREGGHWPRTSGRFPEGTIVSAPIVSAGRSVGAYALSCRDALALSTLERAMLDAVSSALGLWMAHPDSGLAEDSSVEGVDVELTSRQRRILALVEAGRTNAGIAATLGCSPSTVKQELRRIMVLLDSPDRAACARRARELGLLPGDAP